MSEFTGSCHCGEISYTVNAEPLRQVNCHCENCRKTSGGPYLANVFMPEDSVQIKGTQGVSAFGGQWQPNDQEIQRKLRSANVLAR